MGGVVIESGGLDVLAEEAMTDLVVVDIALGGEGGLHGGVGVDSLVGHIMVLDSEQGLSCIVSNSNWVKRIQFSDDFMKNRINFESSMRNESCSWLKKYLDEGGHVMDVVDEIKHLERLNVCISWKWTPIRQTIQTIAQKFQNGSF